jgi:hypothetical protein
MSLESISSEDVIAIIRILQSGREIDIVRSKIIIDGNTKQEIKYSDE